MGVDPGKMTGVFLYSPNGRVGPRSTGLKPYSHWLEIEVKNAPIALNHVIADLADRYGHANVHTNGRAETQARKNGAHASNGVSWFPLAVPEGRWHGIERDYTPADVTRLSGSVRVRHTFAELGADLYQKKGCVT